jgi:hypothetical protein
MLHRRSPDRREALITMEAAEAKSTHKESSNVGEGGWGQGMLEDSQVLNSGGVGECCTKEEEMRSSVARSYLSRFPRHSRLP